MPDQRGQGSSSSKSEAAHKMRSGSTPQERSEGARELSNMRSARQKTEAGRKGGQQHGH